MARKKLGCREAEGWVAAEPWSIKRAAPEPKKTAPATSECKEVALRLGERTVSSVSHVSRMGGQRPTTGMAECNWQKEPTVVTSAQAYCKWRTSFKVESKKGGCCLTTAELVRAGPQWATTDPTVYGLIGSGQPRNPRSNFWWLSHNGEAKVWGQRAQPGDQRT